MPYNLAAFFDRSSKLLDHFRLDIATLRTGRANAQMLDPVMVEAYSTRMRLVELASIQVSDPTMIVVTPWDKSLLEVIAKAIASAQLNLNPAVDGSAIRVPVPALTEEKRLEMVKILHKKIESAKVMARSLRTDIKSEIEKQKDSGGVSEDDIDRDLESLEKELKKLIEQIDSIGSTKEKDLLTV
jgi:ribosome recycling factor